MSTNYITPTEKTLKIDTKEIDKIRKALLPEITFEIPKGYYTSEQLGKILNISKSNVNKRLAKLEKDKKLEKIMCYIPRKNGRAQPTPCYKLL